MNIKEFIYEKKLKQTVIAKKMQLNPAYISRWVNGVNPPSRRYLKKLCKILNITEEKFAEYYLNSKRAM